MSLLGSSVRGTWRHTRRLWRWAPLSIGASLGNLREGSSYAGGAGGYVWKKVPEQVSLHIGAPLGNLGRGGPSTGNFDLLGEPGGGAPLLGPCRL